VCREPHRYYLAAGKTFALVQHVSVSTITVTSARSKWLHDWGSAILSVLINNAASAAICCSFFWLLPARPNFLCFNNKNCNVISKREQIFVHENTDPETKFIRWHTHQHFTQSQLQLLRLYYSIHFCIYNPCIFQRKYYSDIMCFCEMYYYIKNYVVYDFHDAFSTA